MKIEWTFPLLILIKQSNKKFLVKKEKRIHLIYFPIDFLKSVLQLFWDSSKAQIQPDNKKKKEVGHSEHKFELCFRLLKTLLYLRQNMKSIVLNDLRPFVSDRRGILGYPYDNICQRSKVSITSYFSAIILLCQKFALLFRSKEWSGTLFFIILLIFMIGSCQNITFL